MTRPQPFPRALRAPPTEKRPRADNELLDYAADMTAALAYYNFLDDWQDDHRRASLAQAQKLEPSCPPCGSAGRASCRPWPHSWTG